MGWTKYLTLNLSVNGTNAIGAATFNGFGDTYKFSAGQYQIKYNSGGVISYASNIDDPKFNKYELVPSGLTFGIYTPNFFKEQKRYTWQCMYGVLPGFTSGGFYNPLLAGVEANDEVLSFTLNRTTLINFFYTDDCPACAEGTLVYDIYRYEETDSYANGITVLTMNVENPFEHETTEFYHHRTSPPPQIDSTIPFTASVWMSHLKNVDVQHIVDIKGFNTLGLKENTAYSINKNPSEYYNMDAFPADTLNNRYSQYSYWKIIKERNTGYNDLIAEFTLDPNSHNNGVSSYVSAKNNIDKYPLWSYDLLPGTYSIVYLSGATSIYQVKDHEDHENHVYYGYTTYTCKFSEKSYAEIKPLLSEQWINTFCCKYGTLPGIIYDTDNDIISANYNSPEKATNIIQNKILNDEISGILEFNIKSPEHFYIWFNDFDTDDNFGAVTFRLYKGKVNEKSILKEFLGENVSLPYSTKDLISEKQILSKKEANSYLLSIFNNSEKITKEPIKTVKTQVYQYFIEKINEIIKIIEIPYDEEQLINENIIGGPYFSLDDAKEFIFNYCKINNFDYEELTNVQQYTIVIGEQ